MNLQQDGVPEQYSCCLCDCNVLVLRGIQVLQIGDGEMRSGKHLGRSLVLSFQTKLHCFNVWPSQPGALVSGVNMVVRLTPRLEM